MVGGPSTANVDSAGPLKQGGVGSGTKSRSRRVASASGHHDNSDQSGDLTGPSGKKAASRILTFFNTE
jgi:hypothetical protein